MDDHHSLGLRTFLREVLHLEGGETKWDFILLRSQRSVDPPAQRSAQRSVDPPGRN